MSFLCKQISADRWGIYTGTRLLATVSDRATCEAIMSSFENGHTNGSSRQPASQRSLRTVSTNVSTNNISNRRVNSSTQNQPATDLSTAKTSDSGQTASSSHENLSAEQPTAKPISAMSDDELAKVLNVKSVKVKELESAVLQAQMSQRG